MPKLAGRALCATLTATLAAVALATPAQAATGSVSDPRGDVPDIIRLTLANKTSTVVLKQQYADIALVQVESLYIKWGKPTHYRINRGNYDSDPALETRLVLATPDGERVKTCGGMRVSRSTVSDLSVYKIPRTCLPKAPDTLRAKGVATMGLLAKDETALTRRVARG